MFNFYTAYRVTLSYPNIQYVALGIHPIKDESGVIYLIPGSDMGRKIVGQIIKDDGDTIEMLDKRTKDPSGNPVHMVFERLTLERLLEMGSKQIEGFGQLQKSLKSDDDVQVFYQTNFLYDYWLDSYKNGERYE
jgi:hypothetical protein